MMFNTGRQRKHQSPAKSRRARLGVERLEDRTLLSITVTGDPLWVEQGPGPIVSATNDNNTAAAPQNRAVGAVEALVSHTNDPNNPSAGYIVYAGTVNGGVWRSDNITNADPTQIHWRPLTDQQPSLATSSLALDPLDPSGNTLWVGTGSRSSGDTSVGNGGPAVGLLKTTDGGATWTVLGHDLANQRVSSVVPTSNRDSETGQQVVLAGLLDGQGIRRSTDGGSSFQPVLDLSSPILGGGFFPLVGIAERIVADPNNRLRFFAAMRDHGLYDSVDGGATWAPINTSALISTAHFITLAVQGYGPTTVLYVATTDTQNNLTAVFRSEVSANGATSFTPVGQSTLIPRKPQADWELNLVADPVNPNIVYSEGLYRGDATGQSPWTALFGATQPHSDVRSITFLNSTTALVTTDGGVYGLQAPANYPGSGLGWIALNGDLAATEFYNVAFDSRNGVIFGGAQDNGNPVQSAPSSKTWTILLAGGGDGGFVAVDNRASTPLYYYTADGLGNLYRSGVKVTLANAPGGAQGSGLQPSDLLNPYNAKPLILNSTDPGRMLIFNAGVYESRTKDAQGATIPAGDVIDDITSSVTGATGLFTAAAYGTLDDPDVIYLGTSNGQLFRRTTLNSAFTALNMYKGATVVKIVVDQDSYRNAYVLDGSGKIWQTTDAGGSWIEDDWNLPGISPAIATLELYDPTPGSQASDDMLLAGGLGGVFRQLGQGPGSWSQYGIGLPNVLVDDLHYVTPNGDPNKGDLLLAGTFGRGAWMVSSASASLLSPGVLRIDGETIPRIIHGVRLQFPVNDQIRLVRDAGNPAFLDVFLNSPGNQPNLQVALASLQQVQVNGLGGDDTLTVDASNGTVDVPGVGSSSVSVFYDGGIGANRLVLDGFAGSATINSYGAASGAVGEGNSVVSYANVGQVADNGAGNGSVLAVQGGTFKQESHAVTDTFRGIGQIRLDGATINYSNIAAIEDNASVAEYSFYIDPVAPTRVGFVPLFRAYDLEDGPVTAIFGPGARYVQATSIFTDLIPGTTLFVPFGRVDFVNKTNVTIDGVRASSNVIVNLHQRADGLQNLTIGLSGVQYTAPSTHAVTIQATPDGVLTTVDKNGPDSGMAVTIHSDEPDVGVQDIKGGINITSNSAGGTVIVSDEGDTRGQRAQIGNGLIARLAPATISYFGAYRLDSITVLGDGGGNFFAMTTGGTTAQAIALHAGAGSDQVFVSTLAATVPFDLWIDGGLPTRPDVPAGGGDFLDVSSFLKKIVPSAGSDATGVPYSGQRFGSEITVGNVVIHYRDIERSVLAPGSGVPPGGYIDLSPPSFSGPSVRLSGLASLRLEPVTVSTLDNQISVRYDPNNPKNLEGIINGVVEYDGPFTYLKSIIIGGGLGHDTVDIEAVPLGVRVTIQQVAQGTVNIGKDGSLAAIRGSVYVSSAFAAVLGGTTLNIDDSADGNPHSVMIGSDAVRGLARGAIAYNQLGLAALNVSTGTGAGLIQVLATPSNSLPSDIVTNLLIAGKSVVKLGGAGSVQGILGRLVVETVADGVTVIVNDSADRIGRTVRLDNSDGAPAYAIVGLTPNPMRFLFDRATALTVQGGSGGNTFDVRSTAAGIAVTISAGTAADRVNVGDASNALDSLLGPVTIDGQRKTALSVNDQGTTADQTYGLSATTLTRSAYPPPDAAESTITFRGLASLVVHGGSGNNLFGVTGTPAGTAVTLYGGTANSDQFVVGDDSSLDSIQGALTCHGQTAYSVAVFNDLLNAAVQTYTLSGTKLQRTGMADITFDGLDQVVLYTGAAVDTVNVLSTLATTPVSVITGGGTDTESVSPTDQDLDNIAGSIAFAAAAGTDNVYLDDRKTTATGSYVATASSVSRTGMAAVTFASNVKVFINTKGGQLPG